MLRLSRMCRSSSTLLSSLSCPKLEKCQSPNCALAHHSSKRRLSSSSSSSSSLDTPRERSLKKHQATAPPAAQTGNKIGTGAQSIVSRLTDGTDTEDLKIWSPKPLPGVGAPAKYQQRNRFIAALIDAYTINNVPKPKLKAVEKEFEIAKESSKITYSSKMQYCIRDAKNNVVSHPKSGRKHKHLTDDEKYNAVKRLIHPVDKLQRNGYVTQIPANGTPITTEPCNRCQQDFQLSTILDKTRCKFHERRKYFRNNNKYWECCDQVVGEQQGCKTASHHVFKAKDASELHHLIPFVETPNAKEMSSKKIIGLDCEMGYTTKGMELIRLTVLDFYTGKSLFDEVIKPYGEILDLNTQWSGVSEIPDDMMVLHELHTVLFESLIDRDTIIIGHGLENDLNTLRLIHNQVVDTSILYPKGLDKKYSLKDLSFKLLTRKIQTGQHSSEEDSLAAIDIVKHNILESRV